MLATLPNCSAAGGAGALARAALDRRPPSSRPPAFRLRPSTARFAANRILPPPRSSTPPSTNRRRRPSSNPPPPQVLSRAAPRWSRRAQFAVQLVAGLDEDERAPRGIQRFRLPPGGSLAFGFHPSAERMQRECAALLDIRAAGGAAPFPSQARPELRNSKRWRRLRCAAYSARRSRPSSHFFGLVRPRRGAREAAVYFFLY